MILPDNTVFVPVEEPSMEPERVQARRLPVEERLTTFDEVEDTYTEEQALAEAARCLKCPTHWCENACPAGVPGTDFIARVRGRDYEGAYRLIRQASTLPEMCSRLCPQEKQCRSNCTRGVNTQAVGIGRLERFVVEEHYKNPGPVEKPVPGGRRVAVVGSGPSGLSAAQRLADLGHSVTVYEKHDRPGGLLVYGIPSIKLEKGVVARKVEALRGQGVEFVTGVAAGEDVTPEELADTYDAVVLCVGTERARRPEIEGAGGAEGVCQAVEFLASHTRAQLGGGAAEGGPISAAGKHVVILGGGDTGSDCVGVSLRDGCASVTLLEMLPQNTGRQIIYHQRPQRAPEAKQESSMEECEAVFGKRPHVYQTTVKAVRTDSAGALQSVVTVSLEPEYDEARRLKMVEVPGTEREIPCQLLIIAAGFLGPRPDVAEAFGIATSPRSNFVTEQYATGADKVFACGDCRTGQSLVVKAMADGRDCADAVDAFLRR